MIKRQFGCGGNHLAGWENYDAEIDVTKALPFADESTDYVFAEHITEHLDSREVFNFFSECYRILKKGGKIRVCVPSISRVAVKADQEYLNWLAQSGFGEGRLDSAIRNLMVNHGHKTMWTDELLNVTLRAAGFDYDYAVVGTSQDPNLNNIEGHWKVIGHHQNWVESIAAEGTK